MAVISSPNIKFNIGASVKNRIANIVASKKAARLSEERRFQSLIASRDLSIEDQLAFRQEQLRKEQESSIQDSAFIDEIGGDIATLKKAQKAERYRKSYFDSYTKWKQGYKPLQDHVNFLEQQLRDVNDPELAATVRQALSDARISQRIADDAVLDNYVTFAANDKTEPILADAISKVRSAKAKAILGGDAVRASILDLREQSLRQTLGQAKIEFDSHRFDIARLKTAHPVKTLDLYEETIRGADASTPVVIDGIRYLNAQEFWSNRRNEYMASGRFYKDYQDYYGSWLDATIAKNPELAPEVIRQISDSTKFILMRTELKGRENEIAGVSTAVLGSGVQKLATEYIRQADLDFDFAGAARKIDELGVSAGIDVKPYQNELISRLASVKSPIVNTIIQTAADFQARGYSFSASIEAATKQYKSGELFTSAISPKEVAEKTPEEIAKATEKNIPPPEAPQPAPKPREPGAVPGLETKTLEKGFVPQVTVTEEKTATSSTTTTPFTQAPVPKRATLFNPKATNPQLTRTAVDIGSDQEKQLFAQGYVLETKPPVK